MKKILLQHTDYQGTISAADFVAPKCTLLEAVLRVWIFYHSKEAKSIYNYQ